MERNLSENQEYLSLAQAAKIYGVSQDYLRFLVFKKKLQAVKLGRNWSVTRVWTDEFFGNAKYKERYESVLAGDISKEPSIKEKNDKFGGVDTAGIQPEIKFASGKISDAIQPIITAEFSGGNCEQEKIKSKTIKEEINDKVEARVTEIIGGLKKNTPVSVPRPGGFAGAARRVILVGITLFALVGFGAFAKNFVYDENLRQGLKVAGEEIKKSFNEAIDKAVSDMSNGLVFVERGLNNISNKTIDLIDLTAAGTREAVVSASAEIKNIYRGASTEIVYDFNSLVTSVAVQSESFRRSDFVNKAKQSFAQARLAGRQAISATEEFLRPDDSELAAIKKVPSFSFLQFLKNQVTETAETVITASTEIVKNVTENIVSAPSKIRNLAVKKTNLKTGITIYDSITGEPMCVKSANHALVVSVGDCLTGNASAVAPAGGDSSPPEADQNDSSTATTTSENATTTESMATTTPQE